MLMPHASPGSYGGAGIEEHYFLQLEFHFQMSFKTKMMEKKSLGCFDFFVTLLKDKFPKENIHVQFSHSKEFPVNYYLSSW